MSNKNKKKNRRAPYLASAKKLRIETEKSQPYVMTPRQAKKTITKFQELRDAKNRIHELETKIESLARGGDGKTVSLEVSHEVWNVLERLAETGFYGDGPHEAMRTILYKGVRQEMGWLATGRELP